MAPTRVLVLGATGGIGQHVIAQSLRQGHLVTALGRLAITPDRLLVVQGDIMRDDAALAAALRAQDVVISTLGRGKTFESGGLIATSMPRIVHGMEAEGVRRIIFTSAFGVGETIRDVPLLPRVFIRLLLQDIYRDKNTGEQLLRRSDLDWTVVYPSGLSDRPGTGRYRVGERLSLSGFPLIARADVAEFLLKQIEDRTYVRKGVLVSV